MRFLWLTFLLLWTSVPVAAQSIYDITGFGAVGDGITDNSAAIQSAIDAAALDGGGIVLVPAGVFRIADGLILKSAVTLEGIGWSGDPTGSVHAGSWIYVDQTDFVPITTIGNGMGLRNLAFAHDQGDPGGGTWQPADYPFTIEITNQTAIFIHFRDVLLLNPTRGIRQVRGPGHGAGSLYLERIYGQPMEVGIELELVPGFTFFTNIHFSPTWSKDPSVTEYTEDHLNAFVAHLMAHPTFQHISVEHANTGMRFPDTSLGTPARMKLSNFDCRRCETGLLVEADGFDAKVSNFDFTGPEPRTSDSDDEGGSLLEKSPFEKPGSGPIGTSTAIKITGNGAKLLMAGVDMAEIDRSGISVSGSNTVVLVDGLKIADWNRAAGNHYALSVLHSASRILVGHTRLFDGPSTLIRNSPSRVFFDP